MRLSNPNVFHEQLQDVAPHQHHAVDFPYLATVTSPVYLTPGWAIDAATTLAVTVNRLYYRAIRVARTRTYDEIVCEVTVAGGLGTVIRLGIYNAVFNSDGELTPDSLLLDAGTVTADSVAVKTIAINQQLAPGWYFLCCSSDGTPTVRAVASTQGRASPLSGAVGTLGNNPYTALYSAVANGAAALTDPAPALTGDIAVASPWVALRDT